MTAAPFDDSFPLFAVLDAEQAYDLPDGGAQALDAYRQIYLDQLGPDLPSAETSMAVAERLYQDLITIDEALSEFVRQVMPPETVTANADYAVEDSDRTPVSTADQLQRLRGTTEPRVHSFRIANANLEQSFQAVLDHLTAARVAEEMDAPTYLERLRGAFRRAGDGARAQASKLAEYDATATRYTTRLALLAQVLDMVRKDVLQALLDASDSGDADIPDLETHLAAVTALQTKSAAFAAHYATFTHLSHTSMERAQHEFVTDTNIAGAEGEAQQVSRDIERHAFYRPLPLLWALSVTLLVKIVLAQNTSEVLHTLAVPLLVLTFVVTWGLSVYIGVWARAKRMQGLRGHVRAQLRNILMIQGQEATSGFARRARAQEDDVIEFPKVDPDFAPDDPVAITAYSSRGRALDQNTAVIKRNLLALLIPLVLALIVAVARNEDGYDFIAGFPETDACVLASGRMVFATRDTYFVVPDGNAQGPLKGALSLVFPEFLAERIERADVIRALARTGETNADLTSCLTAQRPGDAMTIIHEGNAFGAFGTEETVLNVTNQIEALIAALDAPRPVVIDLDETDADNRLSLTVNLGDASLEVLTQAILQGGGGFGFPQPIAHPAIVDARTRIEIELAKTPPSTVDVTVILAAINSVRTEIGSDISLEQALALVFGAPQFTAKLNMPDEVRAIFEGWTGDEGLAVALTNLRTELEVSNQLAAEFSALLTLDPNDPTVITILNENLNTIIARQDTLIAAISAAVENHGGEAFVVTPTIVTPGQAPGTGGNTVVEGGVFQTLVVTNAQGAPQPVSVANTLVLPFWPNPVRGEAVDLDSPPSVFAWGSDPGNLIDPVVTEQDGTYFERIAETLEACLADGAEVEIDVIGLASRSWDGPVGTSSGPVLNYYLAEGRRIAALRKLSLLLGDTGLDRRIQVRRDEDNSLSLADIVAQATADGAIEERLPTFGRFGEASSFEDRRDTLLNVTGLDPDTASPLEELFGRSVVLRMIRTLGGPCQF